MKRLLAAIALALSASAAQAITFDFHWSGSNAAGLYTASGLVEIDAAAGGTFTLANITHASITISGPNVPTFTFSAFKSAGGAISADGQVASFSAQGNPFLRPLGGESFFGCQGIYCYDAMIRLRSSTGMGSVDFRYASPTAALASMQMRLHVPPPVVTPPATGGEPGAQVTPGTGIEPVAPVPLPAAGLLLIAALGGLAWMRRRA